MSRAAMADLTPALTLAQTMLDAARAGAWDQVAELEQVREACIADCFSVTGPVAATPEFATAVRDLLCVEQQVLALARQRLAEFLGEHGRDLEGYPFHRGTAIFEYEGVIDCNWKCLVDSFCETYHVPILHRHSVKDTLAGPDNPHGRLIDIRLKGPHRTQSVWGNMAYQPNPVQGLAFRHAPGPSVTSGAVDDSTVLPKGLNQTRAPNWSIDVTVFFPNWIVVMGSGMYFTHQMWPLAANKVVWQMRGFMRPAQNAAQRFGQENSMVELRDAVLEDCNTLERIQHSLDQGLLSEFVFHDHELALRHQYHVVKQWVKDYEKGLKKQRKANKKSAGKNK